MRKLSLLLRNGWNVLLMIVVTILCVKLLPSLFVHVSPSNDVPIIEFNETQYHPFNIEQHSASIRMAVSDRNLCLLDDNVLYLQKNNRFEEVADFDETVIAMEGDFVYYMTVSTEFSCNIYCHDISTGARTQVTTMGLMDPRDCYTQDGTIYIPLDYSCSSYYPVHGDQLGEPDVGNVQWEIQGKTYELQYKDGQKELVCYSTDGTMTSLKEDIPYGFKTVIPCSGGLLIHNEGQGDLLYFIEGNTGKVVELFAVECMVSISAVNVHQSNVYLSFRRFEKHGQLGMVGYENDTLEGTYRISLDDYSVEKLSDDVYDGLYIFDDTGIYACDSECNVYKLGFDGKKMLVLLES